MFFMILILMNDTTPQGGYGITSTVKRVTKKGRGSQRPTANVIIQGKKNMTFDGLCTLISLTRMVSDVSRGKKKILG